MGLQLSDEDRQGMTPDELEALTNEDAEANLRMAGDTEPPEDESAGGDEGLPEQRPGGVIEDDERPATQAPMPTAEEMAELLEEPAAEAPPAAPVPFKVEGPADYKAERAALREQKAAIEAKWGAGDLTDEERTAELTKVDDAIEDLLVSHTRAETLRTANQQAAEREMNAAVNAILASAKKAGTIDYSADTKAAKQFDAALTMLMGDEDNRGLSSSELTAMAHRTVLALRGIADKPAGAKPDANATAQAQAPAPQARRDVPRATLADIPNAGVFGVDDEVAAKFSTLEGEDAEDYLASLPQAVQDRIIRSADATALRHSNTPTRGARRARQEA